MATCQEVDLLYAGQEVIAFPEAFVCCLTAVTGVLLAIVLSIPFMKEVGKKRLQKSEKIISGSTRTITHDWNGVTKEDGVYYVGGAAEKITSTYRQMQKERKQSPGFEMDDVSYKNETDTTQEDSDEEKVGPGISFSFQFQGLISVLTKSGHSVKSRDKAMEELSIQDVRDTWTLQSEMQREKSSIFISLLRTLLGKFVASEQVTQPYMVEFVELYEKKIEEKEEEIINELMIFEQDLRRREKDNLEVEEELEMKRPEYSRKLAAVMESLSMDMRNELQKNSGLSLTEVNALYEKLYQYMTTAEKVTGEEVEEQSSILRDRLTKRQALIQQYSDQTILDSKGSQTRMSEMRNVMREAVDDQKMTQMQMEGILKDYEENLAKADDSYKTELERQSRDLMKKLCRHREAAVAKLKVKQEKEKEQLEQAALLVSNPSDVVQAHHDLRHQHKTEINNMIDKLDYSEAEALSVLRKKLRDEHKEIAGQKSQKMVDILVEETRLSEKEAQKMMKKYLTNCENYEVQVSKERQDQSIALRKKLQERKEAWEKEKEREKVEQQQLAKQQEKTVIKVLDSQTGLDDEDRKRIMLQHEQNTAALQNHLQLTRMRQQRLVEAKLAKKRARIEALKEQQLKELSEAESDKEVDVLKEQHNEELATEMTEYNNDHEKTLAVFRSKIAIETTEMLKAQDKQMAMLLGKLQVGQARRRGIIEKQNKAIQELQEKLVDTVGDNANVSEKKTEQIIQKHLREVEEVEEKMRRAREHQAMVLQEKYQIKKVMREKTFLGQLEETKTNRESSQKKQVSSTRKKRRRKALEILSQIYEDNRQQQALKQIEEEMKAELMHQKQEMDRQLEEAMKKELEEHEKNFLGDLAAISDLKKGELSDLVSAAVEDSGGDESDAKIIRKDLIKRVKNAKVKSDESAGEQSPQRKKKGKKKK